MLEKCVFCKSKNVELITKHGKGEGGRHRLTHYVKCHTCHARGPSFSCYADEGAVADARYVSAKHVWNNACREGGKYVDVESLLARLPDDLPYKASVKRVLMQAPMVEVTEVRHGRWEDHKECCLEYRCSVCGYELCRMTNYCPNCSAKMDNGGGECGSTN